MIGLGMRTKALAVRYCGQKRSRKMGKWLEFGGGSAFAWDLGCFRLLLSLEIFTSRSSELCLSETVGLSVGSAPDSVDRDRHRVVELLSHSDQCSQVNWSSWKAFTCFEKKKKKDAGAVWYVFEVKFRQSDAKAVILDCWVSVLPQNPSIAIDIASSSCSRTVTTVSAGELVELESLLVLNINLGKVEAERWCQGGGDSRSAKYCRSNRKLELAKMSCQAGGRRLDFADACTTHGVKSRCDSSENGFPERKWRPRTRMSFFFVFGSKSFSCTAAIHSARLCGSFGKECRSRVDPALARRVQAISTHDCGIFLAGSLTVEAKKRKKKAKNPYGRHLSYLYIEHKAVERKKNEVLLDRSLSTQLQTRTSVRNERQWSFSRRFFCLLADIKFSAKVSARGLVLHNKFETGKRTYKTHLPWSSRLLPVEWRERTVRWFFFVGVGHRPSIRDRLLHRSLGFAEQTTTSNFGQI